MPNWCETNIRITLGESIKKSQRAKALKQLETLVAKVQSTKTKDGIEFLNALYPIPKSLNITSGTTTDFGMAVVMSQKYNKHELLDEINNYPWAKEMTREQLIEHLIEHKTADLIEGQMAIDNMEKYGCKDWYQWCTRHWGTKWDIGYASITESLPDEVYIEGDCAWSPPLAGITNISKEYNLLHFHVEYKEPGCGFQGYTDIENGECDDHEEEYDYTQDEDYDDGELEDDELEEVK